MSREYSERPYRMREKARREQKTDTITFAITAQVVVLLILLLCVVAVKKIDGASYAGFKEQYGVMISGAAESEKAIDWIYGSGNVFKEIPGYIKDFFNGVYGDLPHTDGYYHGEDIPEPEPELQNELDPAEQEQAPAALQWEEDVAKDIDYSVENGALLYLKARKGGGGMLPAGINKNSGGTPQLTGVSFSPVYLSQTIIPPVSGIITSGFSHRKHPVTGEDDFHTGIDIAADEGTEIFAALPGTVTESGESEIYGKYLVLRHADNLETSYSHCSKIIAEKGSQVKQGEAIALVGDTGVTTGPHLHFSVLVNGEVTNPAWVLGDYIEAIGQ